MKVIPKIFMSLFKVVIIDFLYHGNYFSVTKDSHGTRRIQDVYEIRSTESLTVENRV